MPHDPGTLGAILGAGAALLALFAMARVACVDVRHLEIDPDWAALAAWAAIGAMLAVEGPRALPPAAAVAALLGGAAWLTARSCPGRIGQGDVGLFAVIGLVAGPKLLAPVLGLATAFCLAACLAYGQARGKRLGRSLRHMVPAAPPFMAALGPFFAWRIAGGLWPGTVPQVADGAATIALAGTGLLSAGLIAGALPMAVRRRAAAKAAALRGHGGRIHQSQHRKET